MEREEQEMKNKKVSSTLHQFISFWRRNFLYGKQLFITMVAFAVVMGLAGCAKESGNEPGAPMRIESSVIREERENKEIFLAVISGFRKIKRMQMLLIHRCRYRSRRIMRAVWKNRQMRSWRRN